MGVRVGEVTESKVVHKKDDWAYNKCGNKRLNLKPVRRGVKWWQIQKMTGRMSTKTKTTGRSVEVVRYETR